MTDPLARAANVFRGLVPEPFTSWERPAEAPFKNRAKYGAGVTLQIVDLKYWEPNGKADATGTVTLPSDPASGDEYWLADRLVINTTSAFVARLDLYEGDTPVEQYRRDWALIIPGWPKIREYRPPVLVRPNRAVLAVVTSLAPGDAVILSLSYAVVKRIT